MRVRRSDRTPALYERQTSLGSNKAWRLADSSSLGVAEYRLPLSLLGARWPDSLGYLMRNLLTARLALLHEGAFNRAARLEFLSNPAALSAAVVALIVMRESAD